MKTANTTLKELTHIRHKMHQNMLARLALREEIIEHQNNIITKQAAEIKVLKNFIKEDALCAV